MNFRKKALLFAFGGGAYVGLELLWRRRSHGSMFFAGGLCFLLVGKLRKLPLILRGLVGSLVITAVELLFGLTVNRDHRIWDYRAVPGNFRGQICPLFSVLWIPVSLFAGWLYAKMECKMHNAE